MTPFPSTAALEEALSRPGPGVAETLEAVEGDLVVLGAGGKMGPTLARMARRAWDGSGGKHASRRVIAVSRFGPGTEGAARSLREHGVETVAADLLDREAVRALPEAANVIFMAGQKFGTSDAPTRTWAMNVLVPAHVAERYRDSRIVVFSTGCVYPLGAVSGPGAREEDALTPPGEYANSCVGRERIFGHFAERFGTRVVFFRLCYAVEPRYGVLRDVAERVGRGEPVDVGMGWVQVIWQGDANARALRSLAVASSPPVALNVTGRPRIAVRDLARWFGERLGRPAAVTGTEGDRAWIWDVARAEACFGPPEVSWEEVAEVTAAWWERGGESHGKPTRFEVRDGTF
jgi:nucleoside-diphosphate-sugar epimerase